jgi:hypothetical protein
MPVLSGVEGVSLPAEALAQAGGDGFSFAQFVFFRK